MGGRLREIKSLGDGLMLVFESPRSAVSFAIAVQQDLVGHQPRLRVGMHFGETVGPAHDPTGEAVSAAARITDTRPKRTSRLGSGSSPPAVTTSSGSIS